MTFLIDTFLGTQPTILDVRLPAGAATTANNTRLIDGSLRAYRDPVDVHSFATPTETFIRNEGVWEGYDGDVHIVPGPVATDRLYITGDGTPKIRDSFGITEMALPAPDAAPTIINQAQPSEALLEPVGYAVTFVTQRNEESGPSPLSTLLQTDSSTLIRVSDFPAPPANRLVDRYRIYRSQTDSLGATSLYFVAEVPIGTTQYTHDPVNQPINEEIPTAAFDPPPDDMIGLTAMQNGMIAAHRGRELLFCEPYQPHAWPEAYRLYADYEIVGLAAFGTMLAVMTRGTPYLCQGTTPASMRMEQIEQNAPCLSAKGIVDMGYAAAYPSTNGLMTITGEGAQLVSGPIFDKRSWTKLRPETFKAVEMEGQYLYTHEPVEGQDRKGGIFDLTGANPFHSTVDIRADGLWHDITDGSTYIINDRLTVARFNDDDADLMTYEWISATLRLNFPTNYGAIMIDGAPDADDYESTTEICVYADGKIYHRIAAAVSDQVYRLPAGSKHREWQIGLKGRHRIARVRMARTIFELMEAG